MRFLPRAATAAQDGSRPCRLPSLAAALALALLPGAGARADTSDVNPPRVLHESDHETVVSLARAGRIEVRLEAQLGTGYSWRVTQLDDRILERLGDPTIESPAQTRPGAKEVQVFRFEARSPGESTLELEYARPWEKDQPPRRRFRVSVRVTD